MSKVTLTPSYWLLPLSKLPQASHHTENQLQGHMVTQSGPFDLCDLNSYLPCLYLSCCTGLLTVPEDPQHIPASGPLHWLFLWPAPSLHSDVCQMSSPQRGLPWPTALNSTFSSCYSLFCFFFYYLNFIFSYLLFDFSLKLKNYSMRAKS